MYLLFAFLFGYIMGFGIGYFSFSRFLTFFLRVKSKLLLVLLLIKNWRKKI
jgi:hypothetical protein